MNLRALALVLVVVALLVWVAGARPAARELAAAQPEFAHAREERERLRQRTAVLEHRVAARARLALAAGGAGEDPVRTLRRVVVDALSKTPFSGVQLEVSAGRGPAAARLRLSGLGSFRDTLRLLDRLGAAASGLALEHVQLTAAPPAAVRADIDGFTLGASAP